MLARAITAAIDGVSPGVLFQNNEPGVWFDPSDLKTLYQDSAGTTPVTGVEQPVGLMLDKSKGLVLGPELVVNGDFSNGTTGWTAGVNITLSVSGGALRLTRGATLNAASYTTFQTTVGKNYTISFSYVGRKTGSTQYTDFRVGDAISGSTFRVFDNSASEFSVGTKTGRFVATSETSYITVLLRDGVSGDWIEIDNISVRELSGYHATQSTAINRPTLSARYNMLTGTDTYTGGTATTLAASYTLSFTGTGTITLGTTATGTYSAGTSIFSATAGTLTLTVSGQVTNAQLVATEKSHPQGLTYGSELRNSLSGFTTTVGGGSLVSGTQFSSTGAGGVQAEGVVSVGSFYLLQMSYTKTNGSAELSLNNYNKARINTFFYSTSNSNTVSLIFLASDTPLYLRLSATDTVTISNISIREVTNVSDNRFPYQSVTSATVYDSDKTKFPWFLRCTDHWMVTPSIDASAFEKVAVFAALRKMSDAAVSSPIEFSVASSTTDGAWQILAPGSAGESSYSARSRGTSAALAYYANGTFPSPVTSVISAKLRISGPSINVLVNGANPLSNSSPQGTGNYGNHAIYIGKRAGTSLPFNGFIYGLAVRFASALPNASVIAAIEKYYAAKAGIKI